MHAKIAKPDHPVLAAISERWSPYVFDEKPIPRADLLSILEAARWAASAYNEQPWHYIVASRDQAEEFEQILSCLVPPNRAWAQHSSAILLNVVASHFSHNGKANGSAQHDTGLAAGNICAEATSRGIAVHQMAGILPDRIREVYGLPDGLQALTAIALGYAVDASKVPEEMKEKELGPRTRRPLAEFVFSTQWGQASSWLD